MNSIVDCTVPEKILLAAHHLEDQGQSPFSAEALIVASWQKFPKTFGLKGYAELYPDSNKVLSSIMGVKGLASRGWLLKMGQKLYSLSREGRLVVQRIVEGGEPVVAKGGLTKLSRDQEKLLFRLFETDAVEKYTEGRKADLNFSDACRYWEISESMNGDTLNSRMNKLRIQLADIDRILNQGETELSNGRCVSMEDIAQLTDVHQYLEERFSRHLNLLKTRLEKT